MVPLKAKISPNLITIISIAPIGPRINPPMISGKAEKSKFAKGDKKDGNIEESSEEIVES